MYELGCPRETETMPGDALVSIICSILTAVRNALMFGIWQKLLYIVRYSQKSQIDLGINKAKMDL